MALSKQIRINIAEQIVRIVAPVVVGGSAIAFLAGFYLQRADQGPRLYPLLVGIVLLVPAWLLTINKRPLPGAYLFMAGTFLTIVVGMWVSGGIHAPVSAAAVFLVMIAVYLCGVFPAVLLGTFMFVIGGGFIVLAQNEIIAAPVMPPATFMLLIRGLSLFAILIFTAVPLRLLQRALKEKEQAEKRLQSILDNSPDIIYRLDRDGNIVFINETVRKYGYSPEALTGRSVLDLVHPEDRDPIRQRLLTRGSANNGENRSEVRLLANDNLSLNTGENVPADNWLTFEFSGEGIYEGDAASPDAFLGVQGVARDVSRARYFEQQADRLAAVVEQAAEDVIITDTDGVIQYVNPMFEKVTGYSREEVIGKTPSMLKSGRQDKHFYVDLWRRLRSEKAWHGQLWNKNKDGSLILQDVTITPILDATARLTGYASVRRDITEQVRLQEHLQQSQKMEAIGTLAGGIAHDFNNILAGIIGYTELAMIDVADNPGTHKHLERVLEAGGRASDLVKQILSFSRSQKKQAAPVSPGMITKEALKLLRASLPATIDIEASIDSTRRVMADPTNIHQVVLNLCTNAGHAMKSSGGTLSVSVRDVNLGHQDLKHHSDVLPGDFLKLTVEDTGVGMTREIQQKAFDPFFTTKGLGEGTGMGLSTVHGIIAELGGFVSLYSEPGQGTAVHVYIPLITDSEVVESGRSPKPIRGGTERILFVDDEKLQVELAEDALSRYGYRVTTFCDSRLALAHFEQNPYAYDLIVTDMTMPKMTGDVFTVQVHLKRPDIPVILCSGFSETIDGKRAAALHIEALLNKPVIISNLLETIRAVLDGRARDVGTPAA